MHTPREGCKTHTSEHDELHARGWQSLIIFGSSKKSEVAGYAIGRGCSGCGNRIYAAVQQTKKFTLYFIPVVTYGKEMAAICTACGRPSQDEKALAPDTPLYATVYAAKMALEGRSLRSLLGVFRSSSPQRILTGVLSPVSRKLRRDRRPH